MNGRQGKIKPVLLVYLVSVCSFALGVRACECVPGCSPSACEACEEGVCVYQCDSANCETCWEGSCRGCEPYGECTSCQEGTCQDDDSKCASDECCDGGTCVTAGHCDITLLGRIQRCLYDAEWGSWEWCCCSLHFGHCTSTNCDTCQENDWVKTCSGDTYQSYVVEEGRHCGDNSDCGIVNWRPVNKIGDMECFITCQQCCVE
jgi:hypothetical protein